jgi:hypothetical protein
MQEYCVLADTAGSRSGNQALAVGWGGLSLYLLQTFLAKG